VLFGIGHEISGYVKRRNTSTGPFDARNCRPVSAGNIVSSLVASVAFNFWLVEQARVTNDQVTAARSSVASC
jgi:hypothetical protein